MIIDLDVCRPEETVEKQMAKIQEEYCEVRLAVERATREKSAKNRAEVLFELLDLMNAVQTAVFQEYTDDEILAGCQYVNSKNFVRGYLLGEEDE